MIFNMNCSVLIILAVFLQTVSECEANCDEPHVPNGYMYLDGPIEKTPEGKYPVGSEIPWACLGEYTLEGPWLATCQDNGQWTELPTCVERTTCPGLNIPHGYTEHHLGYGRTETGRYLVGTWLKVACDVGYRKQVNIIVVICQESGAWTEIPTCIIGTCPPLFIENGTVEYDQNPTTEGNYPLQTMAEFTCAEGLFLNGPRTKICTHIDYWNLARPTACDPGARGYTVLAGDSPGNDIKYSHGTAQECQTECENDGACYGFVVLTGDVSGGRPNCWLKRKLTYPPPQPNRERVRIYYRFLENGPATDVPEHDGYFGYRGDSPHNDIMSGNRTAQECADWCDTLDNCYGFVVVREGFTRGETRCWLKSELTYDPYRPNYWALLMYFKLPA